MSLAAYEMVLAQAFRGIPSFCLHVPPYRQRTTDHVGMQHSSLPVLYRPAGR
jgi:hypothetical protein